MPVSGQAATRHQWKIENIKDKFLTVKEKLDGEFNLNFHSNTKFQLYFDSCVPLTGESRPFGIQLVETSEKLPLKTTIKFWFQSSKGSKFVEHLFPEFEFEQPGDKCGFSLEKGDEFKFFNKCFTINGNIVLCCELKHPISKNNMDSKKLKEQFDAVVHVDGKKFKVIKSKLMSSSPRFTDLFLSQLGETEPNTITLDDMAHTTFEQIYQWTHFDCADNLGTLCEQVFMASNEYDLQCLKIECLSAMCDNLEKDNVFARLVLAFMYNALKLKKSTLDFIMQKPHCDYLKPLFLSSEWCVVAQKNEALAGEILDAVFKKFDQL